MALTLNLGLSFVRGTGGAPTPPPGYSLVTDEDGGYLVDDEGNYLIVET